MTTLQSFFFGLAAATLVLGGVEFAILGHKEAAFWSVMAGAAVVTVAQILFYKLQRKH
jgi:hypothetical protein